MKYCSICTKDDMKKIPIGMGNCPRCRATRCWDKIRDAYHWEDGFTDAYNTLVKEFEEASKG